MSSGRDLLLQQIIRMDEARILSRLCIDHKHSHWQKQGRRFSFSRLRNILSNTSNGCSPFDTSLSQDDGMARLNEIELLHADIARRVGENNLKEGMYGSMVKLLKLRDNLSTQGYNKSSLLQKSTAEDKIALEKLKKIG